MRLENKVAVITGGAMGIGAVTAKRFIAEGCKVVIGDIQRGTGEAFAAQFGDQAAFAVCDVTQEDHVAALVDLAMSRFGQLDIMFWVACASSTIVICTSCSTMLALSALWARLIRRLPKNGTRRLPF